MKINIVEIHDRGIPNRERLALRVLSDVNLSYYVILNSTYTSMHSISSNPKGGLWLPGKEVRAGDLVIVYSGTGLQSETRNPDGSTNHFIYWGSPNTLWNQATDCAVLLELSSWQTSRLDNTVPRLPI